MYKTLYGFMCRSLYGTLYGTLYKTLYKFMYKFMYRCLGSGPGPRPQWELGQDWDEGPARSGTRAQQLPLRPWALAGSQASVHEFVHEFVQGFVQGFVSGSVQGFVQAFVQA